MPLSPTDPTQAQAWIRGTAPDQIVDFYIPRGNQGLVGPRGPIGPALAIGSVVTTGNPAAGIITPVDPNKAEVAVTRTLDELDFKFYIPANTSQSKNFAIAMSIAL